MKTRKITIEVPEEIPEKLTKSRQSKVAKSALDQLRERFLIPIITFIEANDLGTARITDSTRDSYPFVIFQYEGINGLSSGRTAIFYANGEAKHIIHEGTKVEEFLSWNRMDWLIFGFFRDQAEHASDKRIALGKLKRCVAILKEDS
jgi:hypothetical protein